MDPSGRKAIALVVLALVSASCIPPYVDHSISSPDIAPPQRELAGRWVLVDDVDESMDQQVAVTIDAAGKFTFVVPDTESKLTYQGTTLRLGDRRFAETRLVDIEPEPEGGDQELRDRYLYQIVRFDLRLDTLEVRWPEPRDLARYATGSPIPVRFLQPDSSDADVLVFSDETPVLRAFLASVPDSLFRPQWHFVRP